MKLLVLHNLASGHRDSAVFDFVRAFSRPDDEVSLRWVNEHSSFSAALHDADQFDAVVAAGGDGTVASVCYLMRYTGVPVLPFPTGTANLLAQNVVSPVEPHALAKLVREGKRLDIDLGEAEMHEGRFGFSMIAGCGYDATIMNAARLDKKRLGPAAYVKAAFTNTNPTVSHFTLDIDGQRHEHDGVGVLLANFSKITFDITITEQNQPNDGMLDVLVLRTQTAWDLLPTAIGAAIDHSGTAIKESNAIVSYRARDVTILADPPLPVQYDGEPIDAFTPMHARVLPAAVPLIVSDEGYEIFTT